MKTIILTLILSVFSISLFAQEVTFDKKNFKDNKKEYKDAEDQLNMANQLMLPQPFPRYSQALDHYLAAQAFNPKSALVNYNIGICYLNTPQKFKALAYFQNAFKLNANLYVDIHYFLGRGYHLKMEWDKAISHYETHKSRIDSKKDLEAYMDVNKRIFECRSGKELVKTPVRVWIDNMGKQINSEYPDYGMIMTANASEMFFTSRRPNTTGGEKDEYIDAYFEDVYSSNRYETKEWTPAKNIGPPINTKGHDAAVALSPDGSRMIVYIDDKGDGNLYESVREGDTWSKPKKFNDAICSEYHEASAWYTPDGKQLYFISERPLVKKGNPKDRDIYIATWDEIKKEWGNVQRLPETINSNYNEDGIFVHPDGKTIYFSSKGHNSMGGYDVFKAVKQEDGTWSKPENLGYPINTPDDDVFFVVAANGRDAYMTSFREDGFGDKDLYKVTLLGEKKDPILSGEDMLLANATVAIRAVQIEPKVEVSGSKLMILKGIVRDDETKIPLQANIELVDNETNEVIAEFTSDSKSGRYLVSLPGGKNYGIAVKAKDYLFHSENFDVKQDASYKEVEINIDLKKVNVGKSIVLKNIFFDLSKYSLRNESEIELNRLTQLLIENPGLRIEISGHTDSRGSAAFNKELSKNRAKAVVDYLIEKGIKKDRLVFAGYGMEQPIKTDAEISKMSRHSDKEAAHQQNRRTEFKVLSL
ncbi:MAG TPA: OmpA family protein [Brumimicrobium sp.]|nr:OmpA family protein [Brumimicrobium sp.]